MPWESIKYVSSGLTLAAFIVAAVFLILRGLTRQKARLIREAPQEDRAALVKDALEFFRVDTSGLSQVKQFEVAIAQIQARGRRFTQVIWTIVIFGVLGAVVAVFALSKIQGPRAALLPDGELPTKT